MQVRVLVAQLMTSAETISPVSLFAKAEDANLASLTKNVWMHSLKQLQFAQSQALAILVVRPQNAPFHIQICHSVQMELVSHVTVTINAKLLIPINQFALMDHAHGALPAHSANPLMQPPQFASAQEAASDVLTVLNVELPSLWPLSVKMMVAAAHAVIVMIVSWRLVVSLSAYKTENVQLAQMTKNAARTSLRSHIVHLELVMLAR